MADRFVHRRFRFATFAVVASFVVAPLALQAQDVAARTRTSSVGDRPVTIHLDNAPLLTVIQAIARQAGLSPLYRESVIPNEVRVTIHVRDLPAREAFQIAFRGTGLVARPQESGDVAIVREAVVVADGAVTGRVFDAETKRAVAGATIVIDGVKQIARTDEQGAFRMTGIPTGKYTLTIRRLGYSVSRQVVTVTSNVAATLEVGLATASTPLQEVVTTVTGPQRRLELGHSVGVIKADSLVKEAPITSVSQLLTARVPGLIVSQGQGTVGGDVKLQIRGVSSLALTSEPIVFVDGIRYSSAATRVGTYGVGEGEPVSPLNDLNPNDIESVEVMKGPSASTLSGTDAANGVILITTKRGKAGAPQWNVFMSGMRDEIPSPGKLLERTYSGWKTIEFGGNQFVLNACSLLDCFPFIGYPDSVTVEKSLRSNHNFSILQPAESWTTGMSVGGGQPALRYFLSGTYNDQTGAVGLPDTVVKLAKVQRGVSKLPSSFLRPNGQTLLNLRANVTAAIGSKLDLTVSSGYTRGQTQSVTRDFQPFIDRSGYADTTGLFSVMMEQLSRSSAEANDRFLVSVNGVTRLTAWLGARGTIGVDAATRTLNELTPRDTTRVLLDPTGRIVESVTRQLATSGDGSITATVARGPFRLRTSIGAQYARTMAHSLSANGTNLQQGATSLNFAAAVIALEGHSENVTLGSYVEEMLGFNDRLFLTGAVRVDGASGFGEGYSTATYPKVSASWLISEEPWLPKISGLGEVRIRAALGVSGRQPLSTMSIPTYTRASLSLPGTMELSNVGNPNLRPERSREVETGIDAGFLEQRLQLGLTWYQRRTKDQIVSAVLPSAIGNVFQNVGLTTGHGFEGQLTARVLDTRPVALAVTLQRSIHGTKLLRLGQAHPQKSANGGYVEGYPIGARFVQPIVSYADTDHNGFLTADEVQLGPDPVYVGPAAPTRTDQLILNVGILQQRLRFSALFDRQAGGTILDNYLMDCNRCREAFDTTVSLAQQAVYVASRRLDYKTVYSSAFTRLRELSTALTLPRNVTRAIRVNSGSLTLSVRNLALWTKYRGPDPESGGIRVASAPWAGYSATGIPQSRTWSLRCDLGL